MGRIWKVLTAATVGLALLAACGNDDDVDVDEATEDVGDTARDAWSSFRTGWERLIDEAATGDSEAQDELLEECRDLLQDLREADHEAAEGVQNFCDDIRDADEDADWEANRSQFESLAEAIEL
jgi:hypothetical protein